jgi:dual oxidase maturation factor 1
MQGLPFPILTVGEYFTVDAEGFCWGRSYRQAGYYTSFFLWYNHSIYVCTSSLDFRLIKLSI